MSITLLILVFLIELLLSYQNYHEAIYVISQQLLHG